MGKGLSMGLSDVKLRVTVLTDFSLACPYTQFVPFFGHLVKCRAGGRPRQRLSSAWAVVPKINWAWARGHNFFGPTIAPQKPAARLLVGEEGFDNVGLTS